MSILKKNIKINNENNEAIRELSLNYYEKFGIKGIISELTEKYSFIKEIILYGSKARGDFLEDSDIDLLFVTEGKVLTQLKFQIYDIIYNYELLNDILVSVVFVSASDFRNKVNTFFMKIKEEGITLWLRE